MLKDNDFTQAKCTATCLCQEITFEGRTRKISPADEIISFYLHTPEATTFEAPEGEQVSRSEVDVSKIISQPLPLSGLTVDVHGDITKSDGDLQVRHSCLCLLGQRTSLSRNYAYACIDSASSGQQTVVSIQAYIII